MSCGRGPPRRTDAESALSAGAAAGDDVAVAQHLAPEHELSEAVVVAAADDEEVHPVAGVEGLDRRFLGPLPHGPNRPVFVGVVLATRNRTERPSSVDAQAVYSPLSGSGTGTQPQPSDPRSVPGQSLGLSLRRGLKVLGGLGGVVGGGEGERAGGRPVGP